MEGIVVEATRRAVEIQDVPLAVSAFGTEQITKLQIDASQDIGDNVSGITADFATNIRAATARIHGHAEG